MKKWLLLPLCSSLALKRMQLSLDLNTHLDNLIAQTQNLQQCAAEAFARRWNETDRESLPEVQSRYKAIAKSTRALLFELSSTRDYYANANPQLAAEFSELITILVAHCALQAPCQPTDLISELSLSQRNPMGEIFCMPWSIRIAIANHVHSLQRAQTNSKIMKFLTGAQIKHNTDTPLQRRAYPPLDYVSIFLNRKGPLKPRNGFCFRHEELQSEIARNMEMITHISKIDKEGERSSAPLRKAIKELKAMPNPRAMLLQHRQFLLSRTPNAALYEKNLRGATL